MRAFLAPDAVICWPNTGERFSAETFIRVNCAYPGAWKGGLERVEYAGDVAVCVVRVQSADDASSLHAVSFLRLDGERIARIDEYWSDDGPVPSWRQKLLGSSPIGGGGPTTHHLINILFSPRGPRGGAPRQSLFVRAP